MYKTVSSFVRLDDIFITGILAEKAGVSDFQSIFIPSIAFFIFQKQVGREHLPQIYDHDQGNCDMYRCENFEWQNQF